MSCCGDRRAAAAAPGARPVPAPGGGAPAGGRGRQTVPEAVVRSRAARPVAVRGAATGRTYRFAGAGDRQRVDARDVAGLVRTQLFVRVR